MPDWNRNTLSRLAGNIGGVTLRRRAVIEFAKKHHLIYFRSVNHDGLGTPAIRGSTSSPDQMDANFCIGSHAGYDMALVERTASVAYEPYKKTVHRWYVLQIDLKGVNNLPFIFIGTRQQTKAYYARVLTSHREARYLALDSAADKIKKFHKTYAILSSPSQTPVIYRIFNNEAIDKMATHNYPFALEIDGDTLYVITEAIKPNQQLLDKLLHYGLWMAKEIDQRLA